MYFFTFHHSSRMYQDRFFLKSATRSPEAFRVHLSVMMKGCHASFQIGMACIKKFNPEVPGIYSFSTRRSLWVSSFNIHAGKTFGRSPN